MKKTQYIAPSIMVNDVKVQNILAGSPNAKVDTTQSTNSMDSKGSYLDFDDEEEEDF